MKRRDIWWIAAIWFVASSFSAWAASSADRDHVAVAAVLTAINGSMATGLYLWARRNVHDRRDVLWIAGIWGSLLVPVSIVLAVAPDHSYNAGFAVGVVGFLLTGWYLDRRRRERKAVEKAQRKLRPCPKCGEYMPRAGETCPECHARSTPWIPQGGAWWALAENGAWLRWNEAGERFEPHQTPDAVASDGTAGQPPATQDAKL